MAQRARGLLGTRAGQRRPDHLHRRGSGVSTGRTVRRGPGSVPACIDIDHRAS